MGTDSKKRVRKHRDKLRAQGMKPIQIWVPDVNAPEFAAEAHRQSGLVNGPDSDETQDWIDSINAEMWGDDDIPEWRGQ